MRWALWLLLLGIIILAIKKSLQDTYRAHDEQQKTPHTSDDERYKKIFDKAQAQAHTQANKASEKMVECATCQLFFPQSEAVVIRGKNYCSPQHAQSDEHLL